MNRYALSQVLDKPKNNLQVGVKNIYVLHPSDLYSISFDSNNDVSSFLVNTDKYLYKIESENSAANITISDNSFEVDLDFLGVSAYYENAIKALLKQDYLFVFAEMFNGEITIGGVQIDKTLPFARYKLSKLQFKKEQRSGLSSDTNNTNKYKIQFSCTNKDTVFLSGLAAHLAVNSTDYKKAMFTRNVSGTISNVTMQGVSYANFGNGLIAQANISNASLAVGTVNAIFGDITNLRLYSASLKTLDVSDLTNLIHLYCYSNQITVLDVSDLTNLIHLYCYSNQITVLDVSDLTNLIHLECGLNQITVLDVSDLTNLNYLYCYSNQLTELNVDNLTNLVGLYCYSNQLTELNAANLTNLVDLRCSLNQLTELNVANLTNLVDLRCSSNQIQELDVANLTNLVNLYCYENQLTGLNVANLTNLVNLHCGANQLTELNVANLTNLVNLYCYSNQLTELNAANLTNLVDLRCYSNQLPTLQLNNILSLLDTHGKTNGVLNISNNAGTHTNTTAYNNLIAKGWTITT